MFGGHDDTTLGAQPSGGVTTQEDTLSGVAELATNGPAPIMGSQLPPQQQVPQPSLSMPDPIPSAPPVQEDKPMAEEPGELPAATPAAAPDDDELLDIKQQALRQLSPLVSHLDQTPEEKFRTMMMLIQASDNQTLLKDAYEAAQDISDEKERAQALLDVINEINYFTQQNKS